MELLVVLCENRISLLPATYSELGGWTWLSLESRCFLRLKFGKRFNQTSCVWFPEDIRIHQLLGFFPIRRSKSVHVNHSVGLVSCPRWLLITIRWRVDRLISWLVVGVCQRIGLRNDNRYCLCGGFDYFLFFTPFGFFHRLKSGAWEGTPQEV